MTTKINNSKGENSTVEDKTITKTEPITINNNIFLDIPKKMPKAYSMNL